jgi:hypothetical protein
VLIRFISFQSLTPVDPSVFFEGVSSDGHRAPFFAEGIAEISAGLTSTKLSRESPSDCWRLWLCLSCKLGLADSSLSTALFLNFPETFLVSFLRLLPLDSKARIAGPRASCVP